MKNKTKSTQTFASDFWYTRPDFDSDTLGNGGVINDIVKLHQLAASKRAISNFVRIVVPDKPIKTVFQGSDSYTDGSTVTIGADVDDVSKFDPAVGLALHEAAHIKLSDFELLKNLRNEIATVFGDEWNDFVNKVETVGRSQWGIYSDIKGILNYVEDRRIDQYIYSTAPGYREYYIALYDKYFNDKIITKALQSNEYTDETYENYEFRLINLHADGSRLNALKGLEDIWKVLDLRNISRLKTTDDALLVAIEIYKIIISNLAEAQTQSNEQSTQSTESSESSESSESEGGDTQSSESESDSSSDDGNSSVPEGLGGDNEPTTDSSASSSGSGDKGDGDSKSDSSNGDTDSSDGEAESKSDSSSTNNSSSSNGNSTNETVELTPNQKRRMRKLIEKQKNFVSGDVSKKKLSKNDETELKQIEASGSELVEVGEGTNRKSNCIVIRNVTQSTLESGAVPFYTNSERTTQRQREMVLKGIRLGKQLAGKLQLRSDERTTEYNRLRSGKIDRRMLSMLGAGQYNVFYTKEVDSYNKANLHISLDGSSSMNGDDWDNAMVATVAIVKAIDSIPNMEVQVSVRGTHYAQRSASPVVAIVYDSRLDKFSKVLKLFPQLTPSGTTPEGLTFEAIMKDLVQSSNGVDSYFLNMSDGMPYYPEGGYDGYTAVKHTKEQVQKMRSMGIEVLSYYINAYDTALDKFKEMYGSGAKQITTDSVLQIAKTMNGMFLEK